MDEPYPSLVYWSAGSVLSRPLYFEPHAPGD